MFNEFKEFRNPEEMDYDLKNNSEMKVESGNNEKRKYVEELVDMLGFLEDGQWVNYGLTEEEYINPTKETVEKIKKYLEKEENNYKIK